jgi:uncharacterized protein YggU (UPF0235/DUF167 family)
MAPTPVPWRAVDEGVVLVARVTPRGGRDALDGVELMADGRVVLKLRVRAAPEDGEANAAVIKLLAATLMLRRSDIGITAGVTARIKQILLRGDPQNLSAMLAKQCGQAIEETK